MQQWIRISYLHSLLLFHFRKFLQCNTQISLSSIGVQESHDQIIHSLYYNVVFGQILLPDCWNGRAGHASGPVHAACPWLCGSPVRTSGTLPRFQRNFQSSVGGTNDCTGSVLMAVPGGCCTCYTWSSGISLHFVETLWRFVTQLFNFTALAQ